jgi:hypothetical protein
MIAFRKVYAHYRWASAALLLFLLLLAGAVVTANAQGQTCRDVGQITICGDQFTELPATTNGGGFRLLGNVKIGPKGSAPVVQVRNTGSIFDGTVLNENITQPSYFHFNQADPNTGTTDFIIGEVFFINDPTGLGLVRTFVFDHPPAGGEVTAGRLFVDPATGRIFLPAEGAVPIFTQRGVKRNQAYQLAFITRLGAETFFKDGGSVDELTKVNGEFDLFTKKFKSTVPIRLKLGDSAENPNLEITMLAEWSDNGALTKATINAFKFRLGGLLMDVSGVVVKGKQGSTPAEFEAALVKVLKADNPSVPNLDPTDPTLIFQFTKLKYTNGALSIGGVEVGVKDWEFGASFKMVSQTLGLVTEAGVQSIQIKSTMQFGAGTDASKLPIVLKIGRAQDTNGQFKPVFQAGLTNFSPKLGVMTFKLQNATFLGDAAQDFWGIKATNVDLQWPAYLGGKTAAGVGDFQLGMGNNKQVKFKLGNGTVGLPQLENNVFTANLQATLGVVQETIVMTGTGTFALKLPGNQNSAGIIGQAILRYNREVNATPQSQQVVASTVGAPQKICLGPGGIRVTCPGTTPPPPTGPKAFEMKLAGFEVKVAGFKFTVVNPVGTDDGGFAVQSAALSLPTGLAVDNPPAGGIVVQGLAVKGNGDFSIQGGGFELPPVKVGNVQLVALRGTFLKNTTTNLYEFHAGGKLPLPGAEPGSANGGISLNVIIRTNTSGNFAGMGVTVEIFSPPLPPIPLGSSGLVLTRVTGSFDLANGTATIGMGVTAASQFGIPLGALGTLPIAKADGDITVQFNPFKFTGTVKLSVLIFEVANAAVRIGDGEGFAGGNGMNAAVNVNLVVVKGDFNLRVGKGTPSDPNKRRFALSAGWEIGLDKNQFGTGLPPFDLKGSTVDFTGGIFTNNNFSPARETTGLKGTRCGVVLCIGVFINFQASSSGGNFFDFTGLDKYVLVPAAAVRAAAANGEAGFGSRALSVAEVQSAGLVLAASQIEGVEQILQDTIDVPLDTTTTLVAGINHKDGSPAVSLILPNNTTLTEATVDKVNTDFLRETSAISGTNLLFVIKNAAPGTYKIVVDNAPTQYEKVSYTMNQLPSVSITSVTCTGSDLPGLTVTCANGVVAAEASAPTATSGTINWTSSDIDSPNAVVSVGYVADTGDKNNVDFAAITIVKENLPLGAGTHTEDLSEVGTGKYRLVAIVDDNQNGAVYAVSDVVITVDDKRAPAVPTGLTATPQAGELLVKWTQNGERDLAGYEIGFGLVNDPNQFVYTRTMGSKIVLTGTNGIVDAKIWGLEDNTTVYYGLRAYDFSGNFSDWTPLQSATPWAVSPNTWTPIPGGAGTTLVEIGFAVPMKLETLETALTVKDSAGNVIPGTTYLLVDFDSTKTVGVGFLPNSPLKGAFTATLKGGAGGAQAADGRTMGADYSWSFSLKPTELFLPLVRKQ